MRRFRVKFQVTGRPDNPVFEAAEVEADNWTVDSDFVRFYRLEGGNEVNVYGAPKNRIRRIEEII